MMITTWTADTISVPKTISALKDITVRQLKTMINEMETDTQHVAVARLWLYMDSITHKSEIRLVKATIKAYLSESGANAVRTSSRKLRG